MPGVSEGAGRKTKQFRLQQRVRDGGAVDLNEWAVGTWAAIVDDPRH